MDLANQDRSVTVKKKVAKSNFFRNFQGFEETIFEGFEFVIDAMDLDSFGEIKRGDVLIDGDSDYTIDVVKPMEGLAGEVLGYRIRTN